MYSQHMNTVKPSHFTISVALLLAMNSVVTASEESPNIIVIMADDMGFSDLGCVGAEIDTPHLDALAKNGLLFTNFYNTSRCCPSRAALLTGQYQWDAGIGHMTYTKSKLAEYQRALRNDIPTVAELLGRHGYQTMMSGKWHVGDQRENWPDRRGFEHFYGTPTGGGIYFYPSKFYDRPVFEDGKQIKPENDWYSTDAFTERAINFVCNTRTSGSPFFLYLAYIAPHFPLQAKRKDIQKYQGMYDTGFDKVRRARFSKQKALGLFDGDLKISKPSHPTWNSIEAKDRESLEMSIYAAQIDCMDQNIGQLIAALKSEGIYENTIVMFLSDNGGCSAGWNKTPEAKLGSRDCNAAYGHWYNVSNTPYRESKSRVHEGGIISPLIFHWPAGVRQAGTLVRQPTHIMDILPTCLELAGVKYPAKFNATNVDPLDGVSFLDSVRSTTTKKLSDRKLFWEHEGNQAVRYGDWKLVRLRKKPWQLFNLADDPFESHDLSATHPNKVKSLNTAYAKWAKHHGVQPWPLKAAK